MTKTFRAVVVTLSIIFVAVASVFAQSNTTESLTITTYYPSPYGVYRNLEVKKGLAVGGSGFATVSSLKEGQLFLNNSVLLNPHTNTPTSGNEGEVIYVAGNEHMFKFHNETSWVNLTGSGSGGPLCGSSNAKTASTAPTATANLCKTGTASSVSGLGPWTWNCTEGGTTAYCMAALGTPATNICGTSHNKSFATKPTGLTANLCAAGCWLLSPVTGSGPWYWNCTNSTDSQSCTANKCTAQAHYPAKKCGWNTRTDSCGSWYVDNGCTTKETWGATDTCVFASSCMDHSHLDCDLYLCTEACTNEWDGTNSCAP